MVGVLGLVGFRRGSSLACRAPRMWTSSFSPRFAPPENPDLRSITGSAPTAARDTLSKYVDCWTAAILCPNAGGYNNRVKHKEPESCRPVSVARQSRTAPAGCGDLGFVAASNIDGRRLPRNLHAHLGAAAIGMDAQSAIQLADALLHLEQADAAIAVMRWQFLQQGGIHTDAVVFDIHYHIVRIASQTHTGEIRARVALDVGQTFLGDAEKGGLHLGIEALVSRAAGPTRRECRSAA